MKINHKQDATSPATEADKMKLKQTVFSQIWNRARQMEVGFGMWLELNEKYNRADDNQPKFVNMLESNNIASNDLSDHIDWKYSKKMDYTPVNGFIWLDFAVHNSEELKDHLHVLINEAGEVVKMWETWADRKEFFQLTGVEV